MVIAKMHMCNWTTADIEMNTLLEILSQQMIQASRESQISLVPCVQPYQSLFCPLSLQEMLKVRKI